MPRQLADNTAEAYLSWVRRYVLYHGKRHPRELGTDAITAFLTHLADVREVAVSTQRQAASALQFLYREVLALPIEAPAGVMRPPRRRRLPIVLTREEVGRVLSHRAGTSRLVASLLYGAGLRLMEGLQLRIKDVTVERREILVGAARAATIASRFCRRRSFPT